MPTKAICTHPYNYPFGPIKIGHCFHLQLALLLLRLAWNYFCLPHVWVTRSNATAQPNIMDFQFHVFHQNSIFGSAIQYSQFMWQRCTQHTVYCYVYYNLVELLILFTLNVYVCVQCAYDDKNHLLPGWSRVA